MRFAGGASTSSSSSSSSSVSDAFFLVDLVVADVGLDFAGTDFAEAFDFAVVDFARADAFAFVVCNGWLAAISMECESRNPNC